MIPPAMSLRKRTGICRTNRAILMGLFSVSNFQGASWIETSPSILKKRFIPCLGYRKLRRTAASARILSSFRQAYEPQGGLAPKALVNRTRSSATVSMRSLIFVVGDVAAVEGLAGGKHEPRNNHATKIEHQTVSVACLHRRSTIDRTSLRPAAAGLRLGTGVI